jgi:hypothetical protein
MPLAIIAEATQIQRLLLKSLHARKPTVRRVALWLPLRLRIVARLRMPNLTVIDMQTMVQMLGLLDNAGQMCAVRLG